MRACVRAFVCVCIYTRSYIINMYLYNNPSHFNVLIRWDHSEDWFVPCHTTQKSIKSRERYVDISLNDQDYDYMSGHVIDGRNLLPATGYFVLVWQTIGMIKGQTHTTIPITFRDVNFIRATHLSKNVVKLKIAIQKGIN